MMLVIHSYDRYKGFTAWGLLGRLLQFLKVKKCPHCGVEVDLTEIPTSGFPGRQRKYCPACGRRIAWVCDSYPVTIQDSRMQTWYLHTRPWVALLVAAEATI